MDFISFYKEMTEKLKKIGIVIKEEEANQFYKYMQLLLEWNQKMNLTAITEPEEVVNKHFIDSMTIKKHIKDNQDIVDVGTGAGFPGIPLAIMQSGSQFTLVDSLNKRITFLEKVKKEIDLVNIKNVHSRVEDFAKNYRESYDVATSRAVAGLPILLEYLLPLVKIGGKCICMKGSDIKEELEKAKKSLVILGGKVQEVEEFTLPDTQIRRSIVIIEKVKKTPEKYPRKAGIPAKEPLI
ncbi:MAG: 16S rRNA (guanine(527)-N(7))-methyltransferase RsmG [Clostridia bacterium]